MTATQQIQLPRKAQPLFEPHRFKSVRGGRDGAKSRSVATILLELGALPPEEHARRYGTYDETGAPLPQLNVCARETMESIKDSVHRLLEESIDRMGMRNSQYGVERALIYHHHTKTEFVFKGLWNNPDALKSLEGATRAWVEEAQGVSDDSWGKLIPTVRKDGSEIWLTWNPELETDPTWQRFVVDPPPDCLDIQMNFSDNPWFSKVLAPDRDKMMRDKPAEYEHIWLGKPKRQVDGAIYATELRLAEDQGRIGKVPHQPGVPVYTAWDLGDGDMTAIWFMQPIMGQFRFIDYEEDRHKELGHYITLLDGKGYKYAKDYFPWDAASKMLIGSFEDSMRTRGRNVMVLPSQSIETGIDRFREMLGTSYFDLKNCERGIQRLRHYRYGTTNIIDPITKQAALTRKPVHDDNSHGADAARYMAMGHLIKPKTVTPSSSSEAPRGRVSAWA